MDAGPAFLALKLGAIQWGVQRRLVGSQQTRAFLWLPTPPSDELRLGQEMVQLIDNRGLQATSKEKKRWMEKLSENAGEHIG